MDLISKPIDLWRHLQVGAGLELRLKSGRAGRDADLEAALREALEVPEAASSLEDWLVVDAKLSAPQVSTERLLVEILESQRGFGQMMRDILELLDLADARRASRYLSVEFKFDEVSGAIRATLEEFREQVQRTTRLLEDRPELPNADLMWEISGVLDEFSSTHYGGWPADFPPVEPAMSTGHAGLDAQLVIIADLVLGFRDVFRQHGETRSLVAAAAHRLGGQGQAEGTKVLARQLFAAHDNWDPIVLQNANELGARARSGAIDLSLAHEKLDWVLGQVRWGQAWADATTNELLDILSFPTWRKRHELYSVWVGTRMLKVISHQASDMYFHAVDGVLSFAFGGSRLASFDAGGQQFDVWAELRSDLVGTSAKRKRGIQPDFRVVRSEISLTNNVRTTYVLECKHYLDGSVSNFTAAADDYSRSCPEAVVHVVNHGPIDDSAMQVKLSPQSQGRVRFLGDITPLDEQKTQVLSTAIGEVLFPGAIQDIANPQAELAAPVLHDGLVAYVQLDWEDSLSDMDLAVVTLTSDAREVVSIDFRNTGALNGYPFVQFGSDCRVGPGHERIEIAAWTFDRYHLIARNYSRSGQMCPENLRCTIAIGRDVRILECPAAAGTDPYEWRIAEISVRDGVPSLDMKAVGAGL